MDRNQRMTELFDRALGGKLSRRDVLRRGVALGLSIPAIGALLAACGNDNDEDTPTTGAAGATNTTGGGAAGGSPTTAATATTGGSATSAATATTGEASPTSTNTGVVPGSPTTGGSPSTGGAPITKDNPPDVPRASEASQYSGTKIVYFGDATGLGPELDQILATKFTQDTGIEVEVQPRPSGSDESYQQYLRIFQGQGSDMDCGMIDVIWPGAFAPHLVDLTDVMADEIDNYYDTIVQNDTIDGKLVAIPWFGDFGMLYYRTDLMEKYNISAPPETWDDLEQQAMTIMQGEQASNPNFVGFVFQGKAYEGLTCNALEWLASQGGGTIIENGEVTLNNDQAIAALNRAKGWIGGIAPQGVTGYVEDDCVNAFGPGNSAFMRNWPYAYAIGQGDDSPIKGKFDVTPLPASSGEDHVGTVGGWQLMVSNYSQNKEAATEFIRYLASPEVQTYRAVVGSFVPTIGSVAEDPRVLEAMPFLTTMADVVRVTRPSASAGQDYNEISTDFFQGCNQILNGQDAADIVPTTADDIQQVLG